jgi:hypothetical protein
LAVGGALPLRSSALQSNNERNRTLFGGLLAPDKSPHQTFEVTPHISGKHVHQDLAVLRIEYLAEYELPNGVYENASAY